MVEAIKVTADGPEDGVADEKGEVHVRRTWPHRRYGLKLGFEIPAPWEDEAASEALKSGLSYDRTHRSWNDQADEWEADVDCLNQLVEVMTEAGYTVTVDIDVARTFEDEGYTFLPEHRDA